MQFIENKNYLEYMEQLSKENYSSARKSLLTCLDGFDGEDYQKAYLLKLVADTYFLDDKKDKSAEYYVMAEQADELSLQPKLFFAEFMAHKLKDYVNALRKCDEILQIAKGSPTEETDDDFGTDYYISKANELKEFCEDACQL